MANENGGRALTDQAYLTGVQYRDDANLAARQSVYAYQQPRVDLVASVLALAGLGGGETVADIGCGNGTYLAGLAGRGHTGRLLGVDLSEGMLAVSRSAAPSAGLAAADAQRLPLADGVAEITLATHMLYHVPDRLAAVREFRRITRPGGAVLVVLNGADHLAQLRELVVATAASQGQDGWWWGLPADELTAEYSGQEMLTIDTGADLLAEVFEQVERHDFGGELVLPSAGPVAGYVASLRATQSAADPDGFASAVAGRIPFGSDGTFRVTTHPGLLICR